MTLQLWCLRTPTGTFMSSYSFVRNISGKCLSCSPSLSWVLHPQEPPHCLSFLLGVHPVPDLGPVLNWFQTDTNTLLEQEQRCQKLSTVMSSLQMIVNQLGGCLFVAPCPEEATALEVLGVYVHQRDKVTHVKYFCPFRDEPDWCLS